MITKRSLIHVVGALLLFFGIFCMIVFSYAFFSSSEEENGRKNTGHIEGVNKGYDTNQKGYKYLRLNMLTEKPYFDVISYPEISDDYLFFEEYDSLVLISELGSTEYVCTGVCYCEAEEDIKEMFSSKRRSASGIPFLRKELTFLVGAVSSLVAYSYARDYFDDECQSEFFEEDSNCYEIRSEVNICEEMDSSSFESRKLEKLKKGKLYTPEQLVELGYAEESDVENDSEEDLPSLIRIHTDGCCINNGKENARGGIGVYYGTGMSDPRNIARRLPGDIQTNNRAELTAILDALNSVNDDQDVEICSDSDYSIKVSTGAYKAKKNLDLVNAIKLKIRKRNGKTTFIKVKGHSGEKDGNYYADLLSNEGAEMETV